MLAINAEQGHNEDKTTPGKWAGMKKARREDHGHKTKVTNRTARNHESLPRWKAQFTLQPLTEMRASQSASMLVSTVAQEKEYEEFLADQDNQMWKEMSEEWNQYLTEEE